MFWKACFIKGGGVRATTEDVDPPIVLEAPDMGTLSKLIVPYSSGSNEVNLCRKIVEPLPKKKVRRTRKKTKSK